jgi:hypothetical protein
MVTPIRRESRRQPRFQVEITVHLHWQNTRGGLERRSGHCVEVSASGMRIRLERPIPLQALLNLQCAELRLAGNAIVRHCGKRSDHYELGVEFVGGMEWKPPHGTS